ncbi:aldehyde dehydrogenase family protein [Micromonospora sp. NBC_01813]|uniref:aldehyde dehydrogenase family protein n=1 Tax=Micromonospora sp. NBC_01813 TaxID=2975988 RepID=UPI002DD9BE86|nr:aldehyde dehydrogenase family protein [Micromonospora sp. NBC_01813]WSA08843.1 aldehyde dehydrogenase family protein [Micromonospora sp. NBC_01813]
MAAIHVPGQPVIDDGFLVSSHPATGVEVGRFPVASGDRTRTATAAARDAGRWWIGLGHAERRRRLLRWCSLIADRMTELADLVNREGGKPVADAVVEIAAAVEHIDWAARNAKRVLGPRRTRTRLVTAEFSGHLEYQPLGVVAVIGPWNYPVVTPVGSIAYALAAGNAVVFKPSEYTPATGQWLVDTFAEVVGERPVLQIVHGTGEVGAALCRSGVDKVAFTGSTRTGRQVMATCAETLTPVLIEAGGKDAMIVDDDADIEAAAESCVWGSMTNAGQSCIGIERVYVLDPVYDAFVTAVVERAGRLTVGDDPGDHLGPITMPGQIEVIRRHIDEALAHGARAVLGGAAAVRPPFVHPTVLVDVPHDCAAAREETFGPTVVIHRVSTIDEALARTNDSRYGLGGSVFGKRRAIAIARRIHSGMVSVNSALTFVGFSELPFGGMGDSGFGRIHGEDGLREFARAKSITQRRAPSVLPTMTFERTAADVARIVKVIRLRYGRH